MAGRKSAPLEIEGALRELETLVEALEQGELTLEESLARFERGIELSRACQALLSAAEQRVDQLLTQAGSEQIIPFTPPQN
ncbi:exodeoxyribonuclease VII small subunit [Plasticicumulans acidivorans]|uniref:Exodeoxyribonuclease 7 small subunit n=1 Tax=Plasticicumulans acidivorans TaxID=886464 RepID=A0A317MR14_9GAMM|nr:exodeoxyribonuclease VII small subunit [Plasticicumulans acidivorans]PWV59131.1 exodeoxyribonuclease VII small subunit [Plasticicumulans acidivorans]